ncbi:MAG: T9SS type A sorting domain-containing protein, partial [Ignavibacteriaceae bacterium]
NFQSIKVTVQEAPAWAEFSNKEMSFKNIKTSEKQTAQFYFNISDNAPIGKEGVIKFRTSDNSNRSWYKTYNVKVTPPKIFEVYQNYPNPFNPTTTIKYSIPQEAIVTIKVFNVLGEEVSLLVNKEMKTGIHEVVFDATNLSSGFYFYLIEAKGVDGTKYFDAKKMVLLK